jgi:hypothetical protein
MRTILGILIILMFFGANMNAQNNFIALDKKSYDYFIRRDYENLKKTADTMFSNGIDYYYLRMRLGILSFNKQLYNLSFKHFSKANEFNSADTASITYIYYSYLYSGRKADASLYLKSIPADKKSPVLKSPKLSGLTEVFAGSSAAAYDVTLYRSNSLYYEAVKSNLDIYAGFEGLLSGRFSGKFALTRYRKTGTVYSSAHASGADLNFIQNQIYASVSGYLLPGWEFSGFSHIAFYTDPVPTTSSGTVNPAYKAITEYLAGIGIAKNLWKIRTGANFSLSNFSNSNQIRSEAHLTCLPFSNLNFYFTSGGMYQYDSNWGGTYQINGEIGFKILSSLWLESGIINGNSFLSARNQGFTMNNSFMIPATTIYGNIIILPGKKFSITVTPFYVREEAYSWNLNTYIRTNKLSLNSFGGAIKIVYKNR